MNQKKKSNEKNLQRILTISVVLLAVVAVAVIAVCAYTYFSGSKTPAVDDTPFMLSSNNGEKPNADNFLDGIDTSDSKDVEITMTDGQKFVITVLPKVAPQTVENFLSLVESGFYNGLTFHRIIDGFMAQGGDPEGTGMGGSDNKIKGEFSSNGFNNPLSHQRSVVSMARSNDPDSASSQFFICYESAPHLDGDYAAFGYVSEGMETVDSFLSAGTDANDRPLKEVKIESAVLK